MLNIQVDPGLHDNKQHCWGQPGRVVLGSRTGVSRGKHREAEWLSQGAAFVYEEDWGVEMSPGGLGQRRDKKESALLTFQLPLDPGPLSPVLSCRRAKILLRLIHCAWHLVYAPTIGAGTFFCFVSLFSFFGFLFASPHSLSNLSPPARYWTWALNSESAEP